MIDQRDFERIQNGLRRAIQALRPLPTAERKPAALPRASMFALFEALANDKFLERRDELAQNFDEAFELVQSEKPLPVTHYVPAMTLFAFDTDSKRATWARHSWKRITKASQSAYMTEEDFVFAVRGPISRQLDIILMCMPDSEGVERTWSAMKSIAERLSPHLITHGLRSLNQDVYRLALDHLQVNSVGLRQLLQTVRILLDKGPQDFWDAMGAIAPSTVIDQIFNNPAFAGELSMSAADASSSFEDCLGWITPFMTSLQISNKPPACRSLASHLLNRLQRDPLPKAAREECYRVGVDTLTKTVKACNEGDFMLEKVGKVVAMDMLNVIREHLPGFVETVSEPIFHLPRSPNREVQISLLTEVLKLECNVLRSDRHQVQTANKLPFDFSTYAVFFWTAVAKYLKPGSVDLARAALVGMAEVIGLEKFDTKQEPARPSQQNEFNLALMRLDRMLSTALERISDFSSKQLEMLLSAPGLGLLIMNPVFSSDQTVSEAGAELLKSISGASVRRDAISHLLHEHLAETLNCVSWFLNVLSNKKVYAPCSRTLKICADVMDTLCDSQDGILGTTTLSEDDKSSVRHFWTSLWDLLHTIYEQTQSWSEHIRLAIMEPFCRDTMQFSDRVFKDFSVFAGATQSVGSGFLETGDSKTQDDVVNELLEPPCNTLTAIIGYLKLKDEYLLSVSVDLMQRLLTQLSSRGKTVAKDARKELERLLHSKQKISNMTRQQKAEVWKALEENLGHPARLKDFDSEDVPAVSKASIERNVSLKQGAIDIDSWTNKSKVKSELDLDLATFSPAYEKLKKLQESRTPSPVPKPSTGGKPGGKKVLPPAPVVKKEVKDVDKEAFLRSRQQAMREKQMRDAEAVARAKKHLMPNTLAGQTADAGSALNGIGDVGRENRPKVDGIMVDTDSEEESEDELDRALFGSPLKESKVSDNVRAYNESKAQRMKAQMPVKKVRQVRTQNDLRARLAPNLSRLHQEFLSWNLFHDGEFPPGTDRSHYKTVQNKFNTVADYKQTLEPLLKVEAWRGFRQAWEEGTAKGFKLELKSRMTSDSNLVEIGATLDPASQKEVGVVEGDILLLSKNTGSPATADQPNCLARVKSSRRKKAIFEVTFHVTHGTPLIDSLVMNVTIHANKITTLTPVEREYGALQGLEYYDLCDEIVKAYPSSLLKYSEQIVSQVSRTYDLNPAQARAVQSTVDNDAFTLIQGPPGSGKTKTIVAIVGALLTESLKNNDAVHIPIPSTMTKTARKPGSTPVPKKLLVCAPSNAAVDELVTRLMHGVKTYNGEARQISVIRLGKSDKINPKVLEVTLEELVSRKMNGAVEKPNEDDDVNKVMMEHKAVCEKFNALKDRLSANSEKGILATHEQNHEAEKLKRTRTELSNRIDRMKDSGDTRARNMDIRKNTIRQEVIDGAHVICATLSGSGHEMLSKLRIDFETVVIDEAAQSIELSALIPLKYGCMKCIMVGDPKQLPPTVRSREAAELKYEQSLFVRMQANYPDRIHLLDTQYRMHPEISKFPSNAFYDGRLLDGPGMAKARVQPWHVDELLGPYRFFDVSGMSQSAPKGHSLVNHAEVDVAIQLYRRLYARIDTPNLHGKIGIIATYKAQVSLLRDKFSHAFGDEIKDAIEFSTTDAFQGRECEVIMFSCVRSKQRGIGFLNDIRRMNVGITRAKSSLWVLGNSASLSQGEYWRNLVQDALGRDKFTPDSMSALQGPPPSAPTMPSMAPPPLTGPRNQTFDPRRRPIGPRVGLNDGKNMNSNVTTRVPAVPKQRHPSVEMDIDSVSTSTRASDRMDLDYPTITGPTDPDDRNSRRSSVRTETDLKSDILPGLPSSDPRDDSTTAPFSSLGPHNKPLHDNGKDSKSRDPNGKRNVNDVASQMARPGGQGIHQQGGRVSKPNARPPMPQKKKQDDGIFIKPNRRR